MTKRLGWPAQRYREHPLAACSPAPPAAGAAAGIEAVETSLPVASWPRGNDLCAGRGRSQFCKPGDFMARVRSILKKTLMLRTKWFPNYFGYQRFERCKREFRKKQKIYYLVF